MADNKENPNIEWKNNPIGEQEKLSRKVNVKEAIAYEAKKDNVFKSPQNKAEALPLGLKKIRKKIRTLNDDDEDEDDYQVVADPLLMEQNNSSLYNALSEDEKNTLKQREEYTTIQQQLQTEKLAAVTMANKKAQQAGFKGLKKDTLVKSINENTISTQKTQETLKENFKTELKKTDKKWHNLSDKELLDLMNGINQIEKVTGIDGVENTLKEFEVKEIVNLGKEKNDTKKIAQTICEKTGRNTIKKNPKKDKKNEKKVYVKNNMLNRDRERS